jgi:hypothetical protein
MFYCAWAVCRPGDVRAIGTGKFRLLVCLVVCLTAKTPAESLTVLAS